MNLKRLSATFMFLFLLISVYTVLPVGASDLYDYYNYFDNNIQNVAAAHWWAQTFVASADYNISSVKLKLYRAGSPGTFTVSIRATSGGFPTGGDLCDGSIDGNGLGTSSPGVWTTITFGSSYALSNGTTYAIVARAPSGTMTANVVKWRCYTSAPSNVTAHTYHSANSGVTWPDSYDTVYMSFETYGDASNSAPSNDACSITNPDDSDNLYAQLRDYTIVANVSDADGYADLTTIDVTLQTGTPTERITFRYNEDTDTFSELSGSTTAWTLDTDSSSASKAGTDVSLTYVFTPEWDATEEADLDLKLVSTDGTDTDTDTYDLNYDVVTNLLTGSIECTNSNNPDRVDISSSITVNGQVYYANDPSSSTATTFYPPDAEFTSISLYDSANNNEATDSSIVNGACSFTFTAPSTVGSDTYNLYINMADADYSDGEETPTETIITDRIEIVSVAADDTRGNIGASVELRYVLQYDYDNATFDNTGGSTITGFTWDSGNGWWDKSITLPPSPGLANYDETDIALTDGQFGLTEKEDDAGLDVIGDRIRVISLTANNTSPTRNEYAQLRATAELEYDNTTLGSGDSLTIEGEVFTWDASDSRFEADVVSSTAQSITYNTFTAGSEATYNITTGNINGKSVTVTWGSIYYTITVATQSGSGTIDVTTGSYVEGSKTITATPDTGWDFSSIKIDNDYYEENPYTFTLSSDITVQAFFEENGEQSGAPSSGGPTGGEDGAPPPANTGGDTGEDTLIGGLPVNPLPPLPDFSTLWTSGGIVIIAIILSVIVLGEIKNKTMKNRDRYKSKNTKETEWKKPKIYD